jgi:hypothetical protein
MTVFGGNNILSNKRLGLQRQCDSNYRILCLDLGGTEMLLIYSIYFSFFLIHVTGSERCSIFIVLYLFCPSSRACMRPKPRFLSISDTFSLQN